MVPSTAGIQVLEKACPQEARAFEAACAPKFMSQHISVTLQHDQRQGLQICCALTTSSEVTLKSVCCRQVAQTAQGT